MQQTQAGRVYRPKDAARVVLYLKDITPAPLTLTLTRPLSLTLTLALTLASILTLTSYP